MYIVDSFAISPQYTFDNRFLSGDIVPLSKNYYEALEPNYSEIIPPVLLRRMGKAVRMGVGSGLPLLERNDKPGAIIIGTANGGMENCINFLNQIVEYKEGLLTPTNFVQSTPNAIAGQLAVMTQNTAYNSTHVNGSHAFENALVDALVLFHESSEVQNALVGAVEEISAYNFNIDLLAGRFKTDMNEGGKPLNIESEGSVCGEGATMFYLDRNVPENGGVRVAGIKIICFPSIEDLSGLVEELLTMNHLKLDEIDLLLLGRNGDMRTDHWYDQFASFFVSADHLTYKDLCGEYRTSSAFAVYFAQHLMLGNYCKHPVTGIGANKNPERVLIYNHFDGIRHSLILLERQ